MTSLDNSNRKLSVKQPRKGRRMRDISQYQIASSTQKFTHKIMTAIAAPYHRVSFRGGGIRLKLGICTSVATAARAG